MIGLSEVYETDPTTRVPLRLKDISCDLAPTIPQCPLCQRPIRQFVTQRYNRLVNRAVIYEVSKRFIATGQTELQELESRLTDIESKLQRTRAELLMGKAGHHLMDIHQADMKQSAQRLKTRYKPSACLRSDMVHFQQRTMHRH